MNVRVSRYLFSSQFLQHLPALCLTNTVQRDDCQLVYMPSFFHSVVPSIVHPVILMFICSFVCLFVCSFILSYVHSFVHSFIYLFDHFWLYVQAVRMESLTTGDRNVKNCSFRPVVMNFNYGQSKLCVIPPVIKRPHALMVIGKSDY